MYLESGGSQSTTRYRPNQRSSLVIIGCDLLILVSVPPLGEGFCRPANRKPKPGVCTTSPAATQCGGILKIASARTNLLLQHPRSAPRPIRVRPHSKRTPHRMYENRRLSNRIRPMHFIPPLHRGCGSACEGPAPGGPGGVKYIGLNRIYRGPQRTGWNVPSPLPGNKLCGQREGRSLTAPRRVCADQRAEGGRGACDGLKALRSASPGRPADTPC